VRNNDLIGTVPRKGPLVAGAALAGVGGLVALVGVLVSALAALANARDWLNHLDQSPRDAARLRWTQARAAGLAGAEAWRKSGPINRVS
jgi:hypothetical protein